MDNLLLITKTMEIKSKLRKDRSLLLIWILTWLSQMTKRNSYTQLRCQVNLRNISKIYHKITAIISWINKNSSRHNLIIVWRLSSLRTALMLRIYSKCISFSNSRYKNLAVNTILWCLNSNSRIRTKITTRTNSSKWCNSSSNSSITNKCFQIIYTNINRLNNNSNNHH